MYKEGEETKEPLVLLARTKMAGQNARNGPDCVIGAFL